MFLQLINVEFCKKKKLHLLRAKVAIWFFSGATMLSMSVYSTQRHEKTNFNNFITPF